MQRFSGVFISAAFLFFAGLAAAQSPWKMPSPKTMDHPGAAEAPASDPRGYADEAGFDKRAKTIIEGLAPTDLQKWRKGWFKNGGDPGKYTFGPSMAKLLLDPKAADVLAIQNEDRSLGEHYHFAAVNWARFYPLFGSILTEASHKKFDEKVGRAGPYLNATGTENHKIMQWTGASVLPWYTLSGRVSHQSKEGALRQGKELLRDYTRKLYRAGQGEWDSSTYLAFDLNGLMNIYDFSKDPECRLMAKAALDWMVASYALKYRDGVYTSPNQRGYAGSSAATITDSIGWLWWNSTAPVGAEQAGRFLWAMHAVTSAYRPGRVLCNIANKNLPLPAEHRNSKANYWHGPGHEPRPNQFQETVFLSQHYTLASLWSGFGGQMTRFQVVASGAEGAVSLTGGSPVGRNDGDGSLQLGAIHGGNGMFDQTAVVGRTWLCMTSLPDEQATAKIANDWFTARLAKAQSDPNNTMDESGRADLVKKWTEGVKANSYVFVTVPANVQPQAAGPWMVMQLGQTYVAVRPMAGKLVLGATAPDRKGNTLPLLKCEGARTGLIVETSDADQQKTMQEFVAALEKTQLDAAGFEQQQELTYTNIEGKKIQMKHQAGRQSAAVSVDGKAVDLETWPVFGGPFVTARDGVLTVNDGKEGFIVDFSGELPVYKPWSK